MKSDTKKSNTKFYLINAVITLVVALAVSVGALIAFDVPVVQGVTNFDSLTLSENLIVGGTSALGDDVTFTESIVLTPNTFSATTGAISLTADYTYYNITPTGTITLTLTTTGASIGQLLVITNKAAQNIVIADTIVRTSSGAALTLGQYDIVAFVFTGTEWYELFLLANS
ncbi:MAG: hypothetical protein C4575_12905 [Desulforudis sp.]|jgi:hypothetical protein|nr:MAG: hypothetical protein C4575_12905 [Desulforudis sp.]